MKKLAKEAHYRDVSMTPPVELVTSTSLQEMNLWEAAFQHILIKEWKLKFGRQLFCCTHTRL
jgi:hypothetical protein